MRCDSHVHIVGPVDRYPQVPERTYLAGPAPLDELKRRGAPHGVTRFVIVQPSFYGFDNSATLDALDELAGNGRGVAVIDPGNTSDAALADMHRRGVRGLRINLYSPLAAGKRMDDSFAATAAVARRMNWHIQVIAPLPVLLKSERLLAGSPVPVVIDHYGVYGKARPDDAQGRRLLDLVRKAHVWIKLSAPYRLDDGPMSTRPDREWIAELYAAAPPRCVWGSDWPHPPAADQHQGGGTIVPYRELSYDRLVEDFIAALPSPALANQIMRDNPARLYEFGA
jgi:predicted TIM-barrel fold metal-dependent hydrolase